MLVKNVYTNIEPDVVEIVEKVKEKYGWSFRRLVNDSIRYYWEKVLNVKPEVAEEKTIKN
jgi:hypothetical protein